MSAPSAFLFFELCVDVSVLCLYLRDFSCWQGGLFYLNFFSFSEKYSEKYAFFAVDETLMQSTYFQCESVQNVRFRNGILKHSTPRLSPFDKRPSLEFLQGKIRAFIVGGSSRFETRKEPGTDGTAAPGRPGRPPRPGPPPGRPPEKGCPARHWEDPQAEGGKGSGGAGGAGSSSHPGPPPIIQTSVKNVEGAHLFVKVLHPEGEGWPKGSR